MLAALKEETEDAEADAGAESIDTKLNNGPVSLTVIGEEEFK
jgi:hypothetical protein